jgi:hypothetical protein
MLEKAGAVIPAGQTGPVLVPDQAQGKEFDYAAWRVQ